MVLTASSNLTKWLQYKKRNPHTKFIFEMVDSLVFSAGWFSDMFKGPGRYLLKKEDRLTFDYKQVLNEWISVADCVLCSNEELRKYVLSRNRKAILSPDYLQAEYALQKKDFHIEGKMKLVWEGQAAVLPHFLAFKKVWKEVSSFCELHIITTEKYPIVPKLVFNRTEALLRELPISTTFHQWNLDTHNSILAQMDCGVIPIDKKNEFAWRKPANKLVSFWFTALPSIVSATFAYKNIMDMASLDLCCESTDDWVSKLKHMYSLSAAERRDIAGKSFSFARQHFSDEVLDNKWIHAFEIVSPAR